MLLGGEGLCCKLAVELLLLLEGEEGVVVDFGTFEDWVSAGSSPCSSNNCKFARKTSMLPRRKKG